MMEKLIKDNLQLFENFQNNNWNSIVDVKHMEQILQEVVDKIANHIGLKETPCEIKIKSMKNPTSKGLFNPKTKTIYLESDLFIKKLKPPYYRNGIPLTNSLSNKECFETLIHEFCHACQHYYIKNNCFDSDNVILLNREPSLNKDYYSYFSIVPNNKSSILLYSIQPAERDAFLFADDICREFNNQMHSLFQDDLSFVEHDRFSDFWFNIEIAMDTFHTQTPFEDVDDIIRHINGVEPKKPLNQEMWEVVQQTQSKHRGRGLLDKFLYEDIQIEETLSNEIEIDDIERN